MDVLDDGDLTGAGSGQDEENSAPEWGSPPEDLIPETVPLSLVLARGDSAVVFLTAVQPFPTGISLRLGVRMRDKRHHGSYSTLARDLFEDAPHRPDGAEISDEDRLRWGVEFADGDRAASVDPLRMEQLHADFEAHGRPMRPVLIGLTGGSGASLRSYDRDFWLWPLPPAGSLTIWCRWPAFGIEHTTIEVDAAPLVAAAARARPVWPTI